MKFSVLSIAAIPDIATARRMHDADTLDDEAVSKILYHQRKQSGEGDQLHWSQQCIASMSMVHYSRFGVQLESLQSSEVSEKDMLLRLFETVSDNSALITWNGMAEMIPLIQYRAMMNSVVLPANWNEIREGGEAHLDISIWMSGNSESSFSLDEMSRKFAYPGMLGRDQNGVWDAYLQNAAAALELSDLHAVNSFLMALKVFATSGDLRSGTANNNAKALHEVLQQNPAAHAAEFLQAWGDA